MKRMTIVTICIIVLSAIIAFATPGSKDDPLVTTSYVDQKIEQLKKELSDLKGDAESANDTQRFEAYTFPAGTQIVMGASTEFIVRRGTATIVDPDKNNMPDLTSGVDVAAGQTVPLNHHMLCPRRDGRGISIADGAQFWILIKGDYIVIK